ncbi:hypothetical protein AG1IA_02251 [Rhizoctonia solani AG-1 IA]|uniref:Uncharacterized protein n=1 Tax=Thanatephorus cucumeris (strain AG1-IA) TaxID=983506 RepID=L8X3M0_THACA|nr:hypothetical protein AG1IA_02251 [Rhizoctonia solani AG-1 IA]
MSFVCGYSPSLFFLSLRISPVTDLHGNADPSISQYSRRTHTLYILAKQSSGPIISMSMVQAFMSAHRLKEQLPSTTQRYDDQEP